MEQWRDFYEQHETYKFLGVLEGDYYDSEGKETPDLVKIRETIVTTRTEYEETERKRKEDLAKRRAARLAAEEEKKKAEEESAKLSATKSTAEGEKKDEL
mmetsp:Transcript_19563/g.24666  ORF Transcript_19563/g.24666 Transcript_19563/m.24666 type:complete len:100 (-) Transcript_19563:138-437(-)